MTDGRPDPVDELIEALDRYVTCRLQGTAARITVDADLRTALRRFQVETANAAASAVIDGFQELRREMIERNVARWPAG